MTIETLFKANELKKELENISGFLDTMKNNRKVTIFNRLFKKKDKENIGVVISDYMRPYCYFELNRKQREKFIAILQEEYNEKSEELKRLN